MIYSRSNAEAIKSQVMQSATKIGQSKTEAKNNSETNAKGQNGQNISTGTHSIKSTEALRSATNQYVDFVKENYDGRVADNINNESVKAFIDAKSEEIAGNSLNTMISTLGKMADNLNANGVNTIDRESITEYREDLKDRGIELQVAHHDRSYDNPGELVEKMNDTPFGLSTEMQHELGLRADDAVNSDKWTLNDDRTLHVENSKGGIDYDTKQLSDSLYERVQEAIENGYRANYDEYRESLKESVENQGETWEGTHGLRYNFAQERVEELQENGHTFDEALAITSLELGHSRISITLHYLESSEVD